MPSPGDARCPRADAGLPVPIGRADGVSKGCVNGVLVGYAGVSMAEGATGSGGNPLNPAGAPFIAPPGTPGIDKSGMTGVAVLTPGSGGRIIPRDAPRAAPFCP
jgi:hypothetical protein